MSRELVVLGEELRAAREQHIVDPEDVARLRRVAAAEDELQCDAVIKLAPERLRKLLNDNRGGQPGS
ncbi:MAG: hypothetical protein WAT39_20055 [Planctomycetota bacterium]